MGKNTLLVQKPPVANYRRTYVCELYWKLSREAGTKNTARQEGREEGPNPRQKSGTAQARQRQGRRTHDKQTRRTQAAKRRQNRRTDGQTDRRTDGQTDRGRREANGRTETHQATQQPQRTGRPPGGRANTKGERKGGERTKAKAGTARSRLSRQRSRSSQRCPTAEHC